MKPDGTQEAVDQPPVGGIGRDAIIAAALGLATLGAFAALVHGDGGAYARQAVASARDRYFQSDTPDVLVDMTDPKGQHGRGMVHPLFCGLSLPITGVLKRLGFEPLGSAWAINAAAATAAVVLLYIAQRGAGTPRRGAALVGLLVPTAAAFLFWTPLPETFPMGFAAISASLAVAAIATRRRIPAAVHLATGLLGLGVTITNWMAPLATLLVFEPRRRAIALIAATLAATFGLWSVEKLTLPHPPLMILRPGNAAKNVRFLFHPDTGGPLSILRGELISPVVAPRPIVTIPTADDQPRPMASFQKSPLLDGPLGAAASASWTACLALGLAGMATGPASPRFRAVLALILAGQMSLHMLFGEETFLYALHFLPVLLLVASMGVARWGRPAEALIALTLVLALANNLGRLRQTLDLPLPPSPPEAAAPAAPGLPLDQPTPPSA